LRTYVTSGGTQPPNLTAATDETGAHRSAHGTGMKDCQHVQ
jgi:hypothetical protein